MRAVGEGGLLEDFSSLKAIQRGIDEAEQLLATKERTQQDIRTKLEGLRGKKARLDLIAERQRARELVSKKLKWVAFENDIRDTKKIKKSSEDVKTKLEELKVKARAAETVDGEKEGRMAAIVQRLLVPEKAMKVQQKAMVDTAVEKKMRDIAHIDELLAAEEEGKVDKEKSLLQAREDLARLEREQGEQVGEEEVEAEVGRLRRREEELEDRPPVQEQAPQQAAGRGGGLLVLLLLLPPPHSPASSSLLLLPPR